MPLPCCHAKGVFSGPLSSRPGGLRPAGRRCDVSVAFERENPQQPASHIRQETSKTERRFGSGAPIKRRVAFVRSRSRKTVSASSRRGHAPANTQQGPERPRKAKSQRSQAYA